MTEEAGDTGLEKVETDLDRDGVRAIVDDVLATMEGDISTGNVKVGHELRALAEFIQSAKQELASIRPDEIKGKHIPTATDELDAIVAATEEATGEILDVAETLENLAGDMEKDAAEAISNGVTRIFQACNFQDITGQRISKVVATLRHIEERIDALVGAFGGETSGYDTDDQPGSDPLVEEGSSDEELLNGPQMPGDGINQDEIDALLAG